MGAADEITKRIRESYQLICAYEERRQTEEPKIKLSSEREINGQWGLIEGYLEEYFVVCQDLSYRIPEDIQQIAAHFPRFLADEFKHVYAELRETGPAGKTVSDQLAQVMQHLGRYHARLNELKEAHNLLQECLNPIIVLKGEIELRLETPDRWSKATGRRLWGACQTYLHQLETFAGDIHYTGIPFCRVAGSLQGPSWMIAIAASRDALDRSLKQGDDLDTLYGLIEVLWQDCYDALYRADKALRDSVGELYLFSTTLLGSVENGEPA